MKYLIVLVISFSSFSETLKLAAFHVCENNLTIVNKSDCKKRKITGVRQEMLIEKDQGSIFCEGKIYSFIGDKHCISEALEVGDNAPEVNEDDDNRHFVKLTKNISSIKIDTKKQKENFLNTKIHSRSH